MVAWSQTVDVDILPVREPRRLPSNYLSRFVSASEHPNRRRSPCRPVAETAAPDRGHGRQRGSKGTAGDLTGGKSPIWGLAAPIAQS